MARRNISKGDNQPLVLKYLGRQFVFVAEEASWMTGETSLQT